jgi:hypothetical protein
MVLATDLGKLEPFVNKLIAVGGIRSLRHELREFAEHHHIPV